MFLWWFLFKINYGNDCCEKIKNEKNYIDVGLYDKLNVFDSLRLKFYIKFLI